MLVFGCLWGIALVGCCVLAVGVMAMYCAVGGLSLLFVRMRVAVLV